MKKRVIGFYDYTVILTYLGMFMAFQGIIFAVKGIFPAALLFLAGSLVCDTMDGRVARAKKNRAEEEKQFGVQIDSLCDLLLLGSGIHCGYRFVGLLLPVLRDPPGLL